MPRRVLGVVGTLVWDRILDRDGREVPVEEWGGIAYALSALRAALPDGWTILPVLKVGRDLAEEAFRFLREIPGLDVSAVMVVPESNNRVELRYTSDARRTERLSGGVPAWTWPELALPAEMCDALYVNFISGMEMELPTARALRTGYPGPVYADLHSLFLGIDRHGVRVPRTLQGWGDWMRCFDGVQMNEDEFELLGREAGDPWQLAAEALGTELKLIAVTLGAKGAAYVAASDFDPEPLRWRAARTVRLAPAARSGRVWREGHPVAGDPTGCGDVWGATFFARLLAGDDLEKAMGEANRLASLNVGHRGARGLFRHLAGRLSHVQGS
ncbi:MAG TPA: carbohydrate kinase family protein [Longimicrobiales bacterium]|nr:carbohydrate kinase family protein [Longimicrobiales bacterium]